MDKERPNGSHEENNNSQSISDLVCCLMKSIGYNQSIVALRRNSYRERDRLVNRFAETYDRITAGSKAEGLSSCFESDYDRVSIYKSVVCICGQCECRNISMKKDKVFLLNDTKCHPGHYYVELVQNHIKSTENNESNTIGNESEVTCKELKNSQEDIIQNAIVEVDGLEYVSSDRFMYEHERDIDLDVNGGWKKSARTGPSVPSTRGLYRRDDVFAFRSSCQHHILTEWVSRRRVFGWPSSDTIETLLKRNVFIVPVGCPGSENRYLEWRACFSERVLTDTFNDTQLILYVLLKMINAEVIAPICVDISSFVMKNIVFWLIEQNPTELFTEENLLDLVKLSLKMLHRAIETKQLSYYMLPNRNLLEGKINSREQKDLLQVIVNHINAVDKLVLSLSKLSKAMAKSVDELQVEANMRDELEQLELFRQEIIAFYWRPNLKREEVDELCWQDATYRNARFEMYDIVWPDWRSQLSRENTVTMQDLSKPSPNESKEVFEERYRKFAESYYNIIWPHIKGSIKSQTTNVETIPKERVIELMAVMRLKIEQALA